MSSELVTSCGEDEIRFAEAADGMGPDGDFRFPPGEANLGMMIHGFGQLAHGVGEIECLLEIFELEGLFKVVLVDHLPIALEQFVDGVKFIPL